MSVLASQSLEKFIQTVKELVGEPRYQLWFEDHTCWSVDGGAVVVGVPNRFFQEWLDNQFRGELAEAVRRVFRNTVTIRFQIAPDLFRQLVAPANNGVAKPAPTPIVEFTPGPVPAPVVSPFRLDRFVAGSPNTLALHAALAFVENPRSTFSPLLFYGGSGLGKTHLLRGIEYGIRQRHPTSNVCVMPSEEFTNQFVEALRLSKLDAFRRKLRKLDMLLVDDIQFLLGKRATQEEFLHTLNTLEMRGAKVVLACERHPRRLTPLSEELRSRLLAGMVIRLDVPDMELRRQVLRAEAERRGLKLPRDVIDHLSQNLRGSVRELQGALNYLRHVHETLRVTLDLPTVQRTLGELLRHAAPTLTVVEVRQRAAELFGFDAKLLDQRGRTRAIAHPRMLVMYLARRFTRATYQEIGAAVGGLNHSSVIAAEKKARELIENDGEILIGDQMLKIRELVEAFQTAIGAG